MKEHGFARIATPHERSDEVSLIVIVQYFYIISYYDTQLALFLESKITYREHLTSEEKQTLGIKEIISYIYMLITWSVVEWN